MGRSSGGGFRREVRCMRAFLDTNVILEFFLDREAGKTACQLFAKLQEQKHSLYMTVGSFYTMIFLVDKYLKRERGLQGDVRLQVLRELMSDILRVIKVAGHDSASLLRGINDLHYRDIEDSCQFQAAKKAGCKVLITFNEGDYRVADDVIPRVMTPQEFLETT